MRFIYDHRSKNNFFEYLKNQGFTQNTFVALFKGGFPRNRFWRRLWKYGATGWEIHR